MADNLYRKTLYPLHTTLSTSRTVVLYTYSHSVTCIEINLSHVSRSTCHMYLDQPVTCIEINLSHVSRSTCHMYRDQPVTCI